jgi:polyhydroxyalkanoate synthesis repressor PhaR
MASKPVTIKKYGNRRLYDTEDSRYVTLEELAAKVRGGTDVRVVDAKSDADLTQATLTQIIIEGRGAAKLLPVSLLTQLIRLSDDALAEFFGRYVSGALELYQQMRRGAQSVAPYNPLASLPFAATDALARLWMSNPFQAAAFGAGAGWGGDADRTPPPEVTPPPEFYERPETEPGVEPEAPREASSAEVAELRRELEELKRSVTQSRHTDAPPARRQRRSAGRKR